MKFFALTIQMRRTVKKIVTPKKIGEMRHFPKTMVFMKIQLHLQFSAKSQHAQLFWCKKVFFNLTIKKPTTPAFKNIFTFDQYFFKSRTDFHCTQKKHFSYFLRTNT